MTKVKICCIQTIVEAEMAINAGASALGLVGSMPSGPGIINLESAAAIVRSVGQKAETFLLSSKTTADEILKEHNQVMSSTIQLVDRVALKELEVLRNQLNGVRLVQVIHVLGDESIEESRQVIPFVDYLLLDSGNPNLEVKELGGTGRIHNWNISKSIIQTSSVPVYLAGGLKPSNIAEAIQFVRPYGVDLCSGVRSNGSLNKDTLNQFFTSVNAAH